MLCLFFMVLSAAGAIVVTKEYLRPSGRTHSELDPGKFVVGIVLAVIGLLSWSVCTIFVRIT